MAKLPKKKVDETLANWSTLNDSLRDNEFTVDQLDQLINLELQGKKRRNVLIRLHKKMVTQDAHEHHDRFLRQHKLMK